MNITVLFISSSIALVILIIHSYLYRGLRITLNFFIFAFIWAFLKEGGEPPPENSYLKLYEFLNHSLPSIFPYITATFGWIFTLYISWSMAEKIVGRIILFQNRIFPTLLVCSTVIMSISYSVETTAINVGWWRWKINHPTFKELFIGGYSLFTLEAWLFFTVVFLTAFFLTECCKYRKTGWKYIFMTLPFTYSWAIMRIGPRMPNFFEEIIGLLTCFILPLFILTIFNSLSFEYENIGQNSLYHQVKGKILLKNIPILMMLFMLSIIITIDIFVLNKPILFISTMPAIFILILSIERIPFYIIFILSLFIFLAGGKKMFIPILPVIVIFGLLSISKIMHLAELVREGTKDK